MAINQLTDGVRDFGMQQSSDWSPQREKGFEQDSLACAAGFNPCNLSLIAPRSSLPDAHPSRNANPFATCWTRPGAIPFRFEEGESAQRLVEKLAAQNWWGAIVGPHGCGKSTLLETLKPAICGAGMNVLPITLQKAQRRLPLDFLAKICRPSTVVIVDGYEQLGWFARIQLHWRCRRAGCGLLVTTHSPARIPLLIRLAPDERLVQQIVADLTSKVSTQVTPADVAASHACHGSNVREILFDLYDRHESRRRPPPHHRCE
jgi:hypothetical protein